MGKGMGVSEGRGQTAFADKLAAFRQEISYSRAVTDEQRDAVFRLRYQAYMQEGAIDPIPSGRFLDDYDQMDNCQIFAVHRGDDLVSSVRFNVISKEAPRGPALDVFPDLVHPMIAKGMTIVDPTRLVVARQFSRSWPQLPYLTMRVACMAAEYYGAERCLATVRHEHQAFYRRIFGFRPLSHGRPYPALKSRIVLMIGEMRDIRDRVAARYPVFTSSLAEQRFLFEQGGDPWPAARTSDRPSISNRSGLLYASPLQ